MLADWTLHEGTLCPGNLIGSIERAINSEKCAATCEYTPNCVGWCFDNFKKCALKSQCDAKDFVVDDSVSCYTCKYC